MITKQQLIDCIYESIISVNVAVEDEDYYAKRGNTVVTKMDMIDPYKLLEVIKDLEEEE